VASVAVFVGASEVSLFVNGARASKPQKIPENMCGKALFPTITYRTAWVG
jgi:hypothetical protein